MDVGLHPGTRIHRARLELHLGGKRVVLDLAIALKGDAIDVGQRRYLEGLRPPREHLPALHRLGHHGDDDRRALAPDADVLKQSGGKQGF